MNNDDLNPKKKKRNSVHCGLKSCLFNLLSSLSLDTTFPIAEEDGCLWEKVERPTNSRMARVCTFAYVSRVENFLFEYLPRINATLGS